MYFMDLIAEQSILYDKSHRNDECMKNNSRTFQSDFLKSDCEWIFLLDE